LKALAVVANAAVKKWQFFFLSKNVMCHILAANYMCTCQCLLNLGFWLLSIAADCSSDGLSLASRAFEMPGVSYLMGAYREFVGKEKATQQRYAQLDVTKFKISLKSLTLKI